MFGLERIKQLKDVAQNPKESEITQSIAFILTSLEHDLLEAVEDLHKAQGIEDPVLVDSSREERQAALLDAADAAASGEFEAFWFEHATSIDNPAEAAKLAGADPEAWEQTIETWADRYRRRASSQMEDKSDREIAAIHVEKTHGVPLSTFESEVVDYERRTALKSVLAGNITAGIEGVKRSAEHARSGDEKAVEGGASA